MARSAGFYDANVQQLLTRYALEDVTDQHVDSLARAAYYATVAGGIGAWNADREGWDEDGRRQMRYDARIAIETVRAALLGDVVMSEEYGVDFGDEVDGPHRRVDAVRVSHAAKNRQARAVRDEDRHVWEHRLVRRVTWAGHGAWQDADDEVAL